MSLDIRLVPCLSDNYAVILHDPASGAVIVVDAPEAGPIADALDVAGWRPSHILVTHKHDDHIAGVPELKARFGATVIGPQEVAARTAVDRIVKGGDRFTIGEMPVDVIDTPGHTAGHVSFVMPTEQAAFVGDTLFVLGCGRVFEGDPATMWESLKRLRALPAETRVWCGHEYTLSNARFALTVDPDNAALQARAAAIEAARKAGRPTVPTTIGEEIATNPFLRADDPGVADAVGLAGRDAVAVFAEVRERKNRG